MKLPDLIICPFNRFNLSYLQEMNISEPLSQYLELTYPTIMYHRFQLLRAEEIMVNSDLYDEQLQSILRQNNLNFSDFIQRASLNCPAFFPLRECTEDDDESCINPCSEATEMYTSAGRCFRFPSSIQNASGYGHGYSIIVNLPYELYHTGVNQILNDGILVKLVGDGKGVNYDMSLIPAGVHAIIPLTATRYDFMNDPPRYECEEDPFDAYSSLHCFESCVHHGITEDKCKCSLVASVNPKRYDTCTAKVIRACVIPEFYNPDQHLQIEKCNIKCKPPCKSWAFTKQLSYAPLSTNMVSKLTNGTQKESLKRTIILDIFYEQLEYTTIKHVVAMPLPSLIAQIGGQFSLWAGGSLISLCQIVIYCSRFIFNRCSSKSSSCAKRKSRRKRRSRNCPLEKCDSGATKTNNKISNGGVEMKDKKCAPIAEIVDGGGADSQSSLSDKGLMTEEQLI
ncbi:hypothetical protein WR25_20814 [Diploscapter pachys]|uniref:Amiloride-sensitive sodium channel n=1 Tax=Diploscapter pachys TaxID=2018661 RepID=A0A2A2LDV8_9BILA|nr:hypothetical protein WR25_20814 [Diploscapter pachys]